MEYKDYYAVLGVKRQAADKEIRQAFRRLARQYHPDVNPNNKEAEEHFKEINEAYEVLSDPEKRKRYDEMGADWERYQQYQQAQPQAQGSGGFSAQRMRSEDLDDLFGEESPYSSFFEQIFGRGGQATPTARAGFGSCGGGDARRGSPRHYASTAASGRRRRIAAAGGAHSAGSAHGDARTCGRAGRQRSRRWASWRCVSGSAGVAARAFRARGRRSAPAHISCDDDHAAGG